MEFTPHYEASDDVSLQTTPDAPLAMVRVAAPEDMALFSQWEHHLCPLEQAGFLSLG